MLTSRIATRTLASLCVMCLVAGIGDYVSMPIRPAELAAALERATSANQETGVSLCP